MNKTAVVKEMLKLKSPQKAKILQGFFKTRPGEYGEGDIFWGLTVPQTRALSKQFQDLKLSECQKLIQSKIHEQRLLALHIIVLRFEKTKKPEEKKHLYMFYLKNLKFINNWDLVDSSAPNIVGAYLENKNRKSLVTFSKSKNLWVRRVAILATYTFIRKNDFKDTLMISKILLNDDHDLIHKAVGWMLREVGKRNFKVEEKFLLQHYKKMPRTMLRYAIERFPSKRRLEFLNNKA